LTAAGILLVLIAVSFLLVLNLNRTRTAVILPIANETADVSLDYLSDGLTESIIRKLSGLSKLKVKPLTLVSGYKGKAVDARKIGKDLGADSVLVGRITGAKGALVLETSLINVSDGSQLWRNEYKIGRDNALLIGQDISQNLISKLEMWSKGDQERIRMNRSTEKPEAFNQYMLAKYYYANRNAENIQKAIEALKTAINLDPLYAQAWAGLADCYSVMNTTAYGQMPTKEAMDRARRAANQALELDNTLAEAHVALGAINLKYDWEWEMAEREFNTAIALKPDLSTAHYWKALLLRITGRQAEAFKERQLTRQLDPFSPLVRASFCREFYYSREYDKAVQCLNEALNEDPNNSHAKFVLGYVQVQQGNVDAALQTFSGLPDTPAAYKLVALGYAYGKGGRRDEALEKLEQLRELEKKEIHVPPMEFAVIYLGLADNNNAFVWLKYACEEKFLSLITIHVEPAFDHLRSDPRFADLARCVNLPATPPSG
jgi:TolB-like protein/Tfp pilus assembly protein PilF